MFFSFFFFQNIKQLFALVCETQKYSPVLQEILENTRLLKDTNLRHNLAKVPFYYRFHIYISFPIVFTKVAPSSG